MYFCGIKFHDAILALFFELRKYFEKKILIYNFMFF